MSKKKSAHILNYITDTSIVESNNLSPMWQFYSIVVFCFSLFLISVDKHLCVVVFHEKKSRLNFFY